MIMFGVVYSFLLFLVMIMFFYGFRLCCDGHNFVDFDSEEEIAQFGQQLEVVEEQRQPEAEVEPAEERHQEEEEDVQTSPLQQRLHSPTISEMRRFRNQLNNRRMRRQLQEEDNRYERRHEQQRHHQRHATQGVGSSAGEEELYQMMEPRPVASAGAEAAAEVPLLPILTSAGGAIPKRNQVRREEEDETRL